MYRTMQQRVITITPCISVQLRALYPPLRGIADASRGKNFDQANKEADKRKQELKSQQVYYDAAYNNSAYRIHIERLESRSS